MCLIILNNDYIHKNQEAYRVNLQIGKYDLLHKWFITK